MNDVEKKLKQFEYLTNPEILKSDLEEFKEVISVLTVTLSDENELKKVSPMDLSELLVIMNDFTNQIKPFTIKYGILKFFR